MSDRWQALATAVRARREQLGLRQADLEERGGPSNGTVRNVEQQTRTTYATRTYSQLDRALRWRPGTAKKIVEGTVTQEELDFVVPHEGGAAAALTSASQLRVGGEDPAPSAQHSLAEARERLRRRPDAAVEAAARAGQALADAQRTQLASITSAISGINPSVLDAVRVRGPLIDIERLMPKFNNILGDALQKSMAEITPNIFVDTEALAGQNLLDRMINNAALSPAAQLAASVRHFDVERAVVEGRDEVEQEDDPDPQHDDVDADASVAGRGEGDMSTNVVLLPVAIEPDDDVAADQLTDIQLVGELVQRLTAGGRRAADERQALQGLLPLLGRLNDETDEGPQQLGSG